MVLSYRKGVGITLSTACLIVGCNLIGGIAPNRITRLFLDDSSGAVGEGRFTPIQIDPQSEDSAGPQLIATGDIDGDGLVDVASVWNQSKPLQIHLQRIIDNTITFETVTLAGDFPIIISAGIEIADMDGDGRNDIVLLIKETGVFARCRFTGEFLDGQDTPAGMIVVFYQPDDPASINSPIAWEDVILQQSQTAGGPPALPEVPETGGYTSMTIADIDGVNGPDITVAFNADECEGGLGNRVELYTNPGPGTARQSNAWAPVVIDTDAPEIKAVTAFDVDRDGDLDLVYTFPTARGSNIRWSRNPVIDIPDAFHLTDGTWQRGAIGQLFTGADVIASGDIDNDGITDLLVRSTDGKIIQWYKGPQRPTTAPVRNVTWQVFTVAEFLTREPQAVSLGDLDLDGQLEIVASAQGAVMWFDLFEDGTVFDQWEENLLIDDSPVDSAQTPAVTDPNVDQNEIETDATIINNVRVVDLDGDGLPDIVATLDRKGQSGLTNDGIVWFRNNGP